MHACGHDVHTASLLLQEHFNSVKDELSGTIKLIFQPGEKSYLRGMLMIKEGALETPKAQSIIGQHVYPS